MKKTKRTRLNLKPSARDKRRYLLINSSNKKIKEALKEYLGILGTAKSAYKEITPTKKITGQTIGSCLTTSLADIRTALAQKGINITRVSGTIKGLNINKKRPQKNNTR